MRSWSAPRRRSPWAWRPQRSRGCASSAEDPRLKTPRPASALQQRRHHLDDPSADLGHGNLLGCRPSLLDREPERLRVGRPAQPHLDDALGQPATPRETPIPYEPMVTVTALPFSLSTWSPSASAYLRPSAKM